MDGLKSLRVIDQASEIAGPYCSKLFADAGARGSEMEAVASILELLHESVVFGLARWDVDSP